MRGPCQPYLDKCWCGVHAGKMGHWKTLLLFLTPQGGLSCGL